MKKIYTIIQLAFIALSNSTNAQPNITSFAPTSGSIGTTVNISGTNFNSIPANNIVFFGATKAIVNTATTISLNVTVPIGATYQYISVTDFTTSLTAYSSKPFVATFLCGVGIDTTSFTPKIDSTTGAYPQSIAISDLDGDGLPDLAIANNGSNTVSIYRNTSLSGTVSFATKVNFTTGTQPQCVSIGDLDGDGKPDLAITNYNSNTVSVLKNACTSGTIAFAPNVDFATGLLPGTVSIGDLNGDGKPELVVPNSNSSSVSVFENTTIGGTISFATKVDFITGSGPNSAAIGDLNGDGKPDIAVANSSPGSVSIFKNTGSGGSILFGLKVDFTSGTNTPKSISIGDLNGNGKPELVVANDNTNKVSVFMNQSTIGAFNFVHTSFNVGSNPKSASIGDMDGDEKADIIVSNSNSNTVSILRNIGSSGSTTFATKVDYAVGSDPYGILVGDLDGDNKPDLAVANSSANTISFIKNQIFNSPYMTSADSATIFNAGIINIPLTSSTASMYTWIAANNPNITGESITIQTSDTLNNTIINPSTSDQTIIYNVTPTSTIGCGTGNTQTVTVTVKHAPAIISFTPYSGPVGTTVTITGVNFNPTPANNIVFFGATKAIVNSATSTSLTVTVPAGATYQYISVSDLTTKLTCYSIKPFIVTFPCGNTIKAGSFDLPVNLMSGDRPENVSIFDLDGDGKPDVIYGGSSQFGVFRNTSTAGAISFASPVIFNDGSTQTAYDSFTIADLNGDGKPDIAMLYLCINNCLANYVSVFKNTSTVGNISFATGLICATLGDHPKFISIGDLDGDGKSDLAVTDYDSVFIFRNMSTNATISFASQGRFSVGSYPNKLTMGDLDGDGKPELVATNNGFFSVSVVKNTSSNGAISFAPPIGYGSAVASSVAIGDLDGDGKLDIAVSQESYYKVSIFKNTSTIAGISFAPKVDFVNGAHYGIVSITDLDGDGKPDLAIESGQFSTNTISILKNTSTLGGISFAAKVDFPSGAFGSGIPGNGLVPKGNASIGDLDEDGKPDLVLSSYYGYSVPILKNLGPQASVWSPTVCTGNSLTVGSHSYSSSGNYIDSLPSSVNGCDSTIHTHLTINDVSVSVSNATITANQTGATYQWINCSNGNIQISGQTSQSFTATSNGSYAVIVTKNSCSDTSMCTNLTHFTDVWPGDANHDSIVNNNDLLPIGLFYGLSGSPRSVQGNLWQADPAVNWGISENNGSDIKNADCNGNGIIDVNDTLAINLNFNLMHAITSSNNNNGERLTAPDIYFITNASSYIAGDWVYVEVWLGNSGAPVNNLYGIAFNINYNSSLVQPGTESITYPASWLGTPGTNAIKTTKIDAIANTAYGAITRINQTNASGFGKIADFKFQVKTTLVSTSVFHFSISDYMADNAAGVSQIFNTINDSVTIIAGINEINTLSGMVISPNPFNHQTTITFNEEQKNLTLKIMDELGKELRTINFSGKQLIIEKAEMKGGIYIVQIIDENKNIVNRKIIIQ